MDGHLPQIQLGDEAQRHAVIVSRPRDVREKVWRPAEPRGTGSHGVDLPVGREPDAGQGSLAQHVSPAAKASILQASTVPGQPGIQVSHQPSLTGTSDIHR
jgi:hypothetical protein